MIDLLNYPPLTHDRVCLSGGIARGKGKKALGRASVFLSAFYVVGEWSWRCDVGHIFVIVVVFRGRCE